jgi:hypothetical protein
MARRAGLRLQPGTHCTGTMGSMSWFRPRSPVLRWGLWSLCGLAVLLVAAFVALLVWLPGDDELARRVEHEVQARTGVAVQVGAVRWRVLPTPMAEVRDVRTAQDEPITIARVAVWPRLGWGTLRDRNWGLARLEVDDAVLPRLSVRAFRSGKRGLGDRHPVDHVVLRRVTYVSWSGVPLAYDADIRFDAGWRPREAVVSRSDAARPTLLRLTRQGDEDRWRAHAEAGGGSGEGELTLTETAEGLITVQGSFEPRRVEVQSAIAAFKRRSPIAGLASGRTRVHAQGTSPGELGRSLRTESDLTVEQGVVLRLDIDRAVKSLGREREGQTKLDTLSGRVVTQNTGQGGMRVTYSGIQATAGGYKAEGEATVYRRHVSAKGSLDMAGGAVDVPFTVEGPTRKPDFRIAPGFYAGAAVGTAILPGIGTVIGAKIGGLLGRGDATPSTSKPASSPPARPPAPRSR